jgi:hypothetical protein
MKTWLASGARVPYRFVDEGSGSAISTDFISCRLHLINQKSDEDGSVKRAMEDFDDAAQRSLYSTHRYDRNAPHAPAARSRHSPAGSLHEWSDIQEDTLLSVCLVRQT